MKKKHKLTCASFSLMFLILSTIILKDKNPILALVAFGDLAVTFMLAPRKSVIGFSLSMIAASFMLQFLSGAQIFFLVLSLVATATIASLRFLKKRPDYRPTTDMWVGSLLLMETTAILICLI